jgi:hypothetical protein
MGRNVPDKRSIVVGMNGPGPVPCVVGCIGDESFLSGHGKEFPPRLREQVAPVGFEPFRIALGSLVLGTAALDLSLVCDLFDQNRFALGD